MRYFLLNPTSSKYSKTLRNGMKAFFPFNHALWNIIETGMFKINTMINFASIFFVFIVKNSLW